MVENLMWNSILYLAMKLAKYASSSVETSWYFHLLTCKVARGIWLRVAWSELIVLASAEVTIGMNRGDWCCRYWMSPVADWERTWTAIISACMVDRVAWSITWEKTDVGIVVTSVEAAVKTMINYWNFTSYFVYTNLFGQKEESFKYSNSDWLYVD